MRRILKEAREMPIPASRPRQKLSNKSIYAIATLLLFTVPLTGCKTIQGYTVKDKQDYIQEMAKDVLSELYELKPEAKEQVELYAGYAVFSNAAVNLFVVGTGNGYGVAHDNTTKKETYMKMFKAGGGLGIGVQDYRMVITFKRPEDFARFIESGWDFSGQLDLSSMTYEGGIALSSAVSADLNITIYQMTRAGLSIQAMLYATKFWKLDELN
jgi:lipid-binding SYLF domain-containing protein